MAREPLRVLGVDTSLRSTGVGVVEARGNVLRAVQYGTVRNPASRTHSQCLGHIHEALSRLLAEERPQAVAVEGIFYCKNLRTAVTLGEARGAVLAAAAQAGVPVYEYPPRRVKQALVGTGAAGKGQVAKMVMSLLGLADQPQADAADALAIAICHLHSQSGYAALAPKQI